VNSESGQERTEAATPKRLDEARRRGQAARSREFNAAIVLLAGSATLILLGDWMTSRLMQVMRDGLSPTRAMLMDDNAIFAALTGATLSGIMLLAPFFLVMAVAALFGGTAVGGWVFSGDAVSPDFERVNPVSGFGRVFSLRGLLELLKALIKFGVVLAVAGLLAKNLAGDLLNLGLAPAGRGIVEAGRLLAWALLILCSAMGLFAVVDVPFQIWDHQRRLRMTRQEVREELKETEGRPEVKGRIRRLQRELTRNRMIAEVPRADVVIVNPTHVSVALRYDRQKNAAPILVAKGADLIALQILTTARAAGVPVVQAPPLARAIYCSTRLNHPIATGLYVAVARILAYVYQLRALDLHGEPPAVPNEDDLPIPPDLRN
jgi:flagellar biosynthetic protein FlhB